LIDKNPDLECIIALAKVEFRNLEIKKEYQMRVISKNEDEIENLLAEEGLLNIICL
jgi:hypothetical protein